MKLMSVMLLAACLQVCAKGVSQKITLAEKNASLEQVFRSIEKQTKFVFFFDYELLQNKKKVDINVKDASLDDVLQRCLKQQSLSYSIVGNTIVLQSKEEKEIPPVPQAAMPPPLRIKGKVANEKGEPLSGASVTIAGTKTGTATDNNGEFSLSLEEGSRLNISFVGYEAREVVVNNDNDLNIILKAIETKVEEIVVIGYGTARKSDLTGAVSQIKSREITALPTTNVVAALQGRAAGVQVIRNNGSPGAGISVRIRGINSILGGNEPLYVIDGFPYSGNPTFLQNGDIESIEILKDASSIAIYGSRGANGVVLITTKSGRKNSKTTIDLESSYSVQRVNRKMKLLSPRQYGELYNEQAKNDNLAPYFTAQQLDSFSTMKAVDWQDLILQDAPMYSTSLTMNGGNDKTRFSLSTGIFLQDGIVKNSDFDRYSIRGSISHDISKIFSVSYNATLTRISRRLQNSGLGNRGSDVFSAMLMAPPTLTPYLEDGSYRRLNTAYPFISNALINPMVNLNEISEKVKADRVFSNAAITIRPVDGLSLRISGGIENSHDRTDFYFNNEPSVNSVGSASINTSQLTSLLNENVATYTKKFGGHSITATAGFTYQDYVFSNTSASGVGFLSDVTGTGNLSSAATPGIPSSGYSKWTLLSYLGRINYSLMDKYLLTVSFRRDGSSRYSAENKWSNFPSAALAWRVSKENFFRSVNFISDLKLRASYGATGSTAIGPYQTLNQLVSGNTIFGDALYTAYAPGTTLPGNLKWETTNQFDAGLDIAFLQNRIRLTADFYLKRTKNLLNNVQLPASTGYNVTVQNVGEIENKGVELVLEGDILQGNVGWTVSANMAINRNKVIKLYNGQDIYGNTIYTGSLNDYVNLLREGQPLGIFNGYVEKGYTATGNLEYEDLNGDGVISALDKTYIGNPNPKFIYGINSITSYKGFELTLFLQGSYGNNIFNLNKAATLDLGMGLNLPEEVYTDHWTSEKTTAKYPKITRTLSGNMSTRFVEDGSYLRFKNIQLAYNLPVKKLRRQWVRNAQLYVSAQNIITLTKYSWYDPEINVYGSANSVTQGIDYSSYPASKSVTVGIRCGF